MSLLQTFPLLYLRPAGKSTSAGQPMRSRLSLSEIEMLERFSRPTSIEDAVIDGYPRPMIEAAYREGLLVDCDKGGVSEGTTWESDNLQRAACYMFTDFASKSDCGFHTYFKQNVAEIGHHLSTLLNRRTERFFTDEKIKLETLKEIARDVDFAIGQSRWLDFRVLVQGVEGLERAVYRYNRELESFEVCCSQYKRQDLLECCHGQWWLNGGGVSWFFVISMDALKKHEESTPRNYFEMILLLGAAGQALVNTVYEHGLGSWMTPALSESLAAKLLNLDESEEESLYFFKIGIPDRGNQSSEERRSPI